MRSKGSVTDPTGAGPDAAGVEDVRSTSAIVIEIACFRTGRIRSWLASDVESASLRPSLAMIRVKSANTVSEPERCADIWRSGDGVGSACGPSSSDVEK